MSLGFLTESALLPAKSKPIKVHGSSLVDLKAIVYAKEQKVGRTGGAASVSGSGVRARRGRRSSDDGDAKARKDPFARSNKGVQDRSQRDEDDRVTPSKKRTAAQRILAAKSSLYEKMAKGEVGGVSPAGSLVDFSRKTGADLALLESKGVGKPKKKRQKGDGGSGGDGIPSSDIDSRPPSADGRGGASGKKKRVGAEEDGSKYFYGDDAEENPDEDDHLSDYSDGGEDGSSGYGLEIEIVDEFGRHRKVTRGGTEHREYLKAKRRAAERESELRAAAKAAKEEATSEASSFDERYSYRGNRGAPPPSSHSSSSSSPPAGGAPAGRWAWSSGAGRGSDGGDFETREGQDRRAEKGMAELLEREGGGAESGKKDGSGAKILSQWEKTLTGDQKAHLREVQRETDAGRKRAMARGKAVGASVAGASAGMSDRMRQRAERKELLRRKQKARTADSQKDP